MWPDVVPWGIFAATAGVMVYITERDKKRERKDAAPVDSFRDWKPLDFVSPVDSFRDWKPITFDFGVIEKRLIAETATEQQVKNRIVDELGEELGYKNMGNMLWSMRDDVPPRQITKIERTFWDTLVAERMGRRPYNPFAVKYEDYVPFSELLMR